MCCCTLLPTKSPGSCLERRIKGSSTKACSSSASTTSKLFQGQTPTHLARAVLGSMMRIHIVSKRDDDIKIMLNRIMLRPSGVEWSGPSWAEDPGAPVVLGVLPLSLQFQAPDPAKLPFAASVWTWASVSPRELSCSGLGPTHRSSHHTYPGTLAQPLWCPCVFQGAALSRPSAPPQLSLVS